jgi:hypothetical protein
VEQNGMEVNDKNVQGRQTKIAEKKKRREDAILTCKIL